MINYHPDDNLLTEYASGSLPVAIGLSVSAHLQMCPQCAKQTEQLNRLGGVILTTSKSEVVSSDCFAQLMTRIHQQDSKTQAQSTCAKAHLPYPDLAVDKLPKVVKKLLPADGKLTWKRVSSILKTAYLTVGQGDYEVALQKIRSGGEVIEHDHRGLEITLVLSGSFSDEHGVYSEGDFLVRNPGDIHRPTATKNEDCLCLSVMSAPVAITGLVGKLLNPFVAFKPA